MLTVSTTPEVFSSAGPHAEQPNSNMTHKMLKKAMNSDRRDRLIFCLICAGQQYYPCTLILKVQSMHQPLSSHVSPTVAAVTIPGDSHPDAGSAVLQLVMVVSAPAGG